MTFKEDITTRINSDFGNDSDKVLKLLNDVINSTHYLKTDSVIRCIGCKRIENNLTSNNYF